MRVIKYFLLFIFSFYLTALASATEMKKIYILQTVSHSALDATLKGIVDQLNSQNFIDGKTAEIKISNAQGEPALANQMAVKFSSKKPDIIIAIATMAAQSAVNAIKNSNIPVVFATVTDPVGSGVVKDTYNVTGVSNLVSLDAQLKIFKKIIPNLKKLGIIYNPSEANSVKLVSLTKKIVSRFNIELITAAATKTLDVSPATNKIIKDVDAIFINNDNTALSAFPLITKIANKHKKPVFVSDTDLLNKGALAAFGPNQYDIGKQAADMVVKILKGEKARNIKFTYPTQVQLLLNNKAAEKLKITFSKDILEQAKNE